MCPLLFSSVFYMYICLYGCLSQCVVFFCLSSLIVFVRFFVFLHFLIFLLGVLSYESVIYKVFSG